MNPTPTLPMQREEVDESLADALATIRAILKKSSDECLGKIEVAIRNTNREQALAAVNKMFDELHGFEVVHRDSPLNALAINVRTVNHLNSLTILTVGEICALSEHELSTVRRMGPRAIAELKNALERHGFALRR